MPFPQLEVALLGADGQTPAKITRVEIDLLDNGRFRWTLWSAGRRLISLTGDDRDRWAMIVATDKIVAAELAAFDSSQP